MMKVIYALIALVVCGMECSAQTVSGRVDGHDFVDLGLPSGTKWATCNVGANKPAEFGDYFAWGETQPKENYAWITYKWCLVDSMGLYSQVTKYVSDKDYGAVDNVKVLYAEDDAASANWGSGWRMPTLDECKELQDGCIWTFTKDYNGTGIAGMAGTSKKNGNTIFLPASSVRSGTKLFDACYGNYYWSSSLCEYYSNNAFGFYFKVNDFDMDYNDRDFGRSVRAVVK